MSIVVLDVDRWHIECIPEDGARISVLKYSGYNLLTAAPHVFMPPGNFYGEYEKRPVYGYDDCFPTVEPCYFPGDNFMCKDHGELCWQEWQVNIGQNQIICSTECNKPNVSFKRILEFSGNTLSWKFELINKSDTILPFLHVMHMLMPLRDIKSIELADFEEVIDEAVPVELNLQNSREIEKRLLSLWPGAFIMLLLKNISEGFVRLGFKNGLSLQINYDCETFPVLGIWWNNAGYPDKCGHKRIECAFEPIPGTCSNLEKSFIDGVYMQAKSGEKTEWLIKMQCS